MTYHGGDVKPYSLTHSRSGRSVALSGALAVQKDISNNVRLVASSPDIIERNRHIFNFKLTVNDCTRLAHSRVLSSLDR